MDKEIDNDELSNELRSLNTKRSKFNFFTPEYHDLSLIITNKSNLLIERLKIKRKFKVRYYIIQEKQRNENKEETLNYFLNNSSISNKLKRRELYDMVIIIGEWADDFWNMIHRKVTYTLFIGENGIDIAKADINNDKNNGILLPPNFYLFIQTLGFDLAFAYRLYELNKSKRLGNLNIYQIKPREGFWPLLMDNKEKI